MSVSPAIEVLPLVNALLILISGVAAVLGFAFIRSRKVRAHHRSMLTAAGFAALFLIVYILRVLLLGTKAFGGTGFIRTVYLTVLGFHMVVATLLAPLVLVTIRRALRGEFARHRRIARVALPVWISVAATGWIVYVLLY